MEITPQNSARVEQGLGLAVSKTGEMAVAGAAAKAKAMVEAKFVIALQRPRNIMDARAKILEACRRPAFAAIARYAKPVGGSKICGPSIRFAETAIQAMRNIDVTTTIVWEDDEKRTINIAVTDLETNSTYSKDVTIGKVVERKFVKEGQTVISERLNSQNQKVFLVAATEDDLANKVAAAESKIIRNSGLRLIPQDIIDEAMEIAQETIRKGGSDPKADMKRMCDAFGSINISPLELEKYLGHSIATASPEEVADLREIYTAIKDGESNWGDYLKARGDEPAMTSAPAPSTRKSEPAETPKTVKQSPQNELSDFIIAQGFTFDTFRTWAVESSQIEAKDADSMQSFDDVDAALAKRLLRASAGLLAGLKGVRA
jgi:hypothetical protein